MDDFTPRNIAKFVVSTTISLSVAQGTRNAVVDHTDIKKDTKTVKITSGVIGWGVAKKLEPLTDKLVDKTADWLVARKAAQAE